MIPTGYGSIYDDSKVTGLEGAKFTLYARLDPQQDTLSTELKNQGVLWLKTDGTTSDAAAKPAGAVLVYPALNAKGERVAMSRTDGSVDGAGRLRFHNLLAGTYYLVETEAPVGYHSNLHYTTIVLKPGKNGEEATVYIQPGYNGNGQVTALWRTEVKDGKSTIVQELIIQNTSGVELPNTGGFGTHWFTAAGAALMLGALALLIKQKRRKEVVQTE